MLRLSPWLSCALVLAAPACCVASTTLIATPRGDVVAGALVVGDIVLSVDPATGRQRHARVVGIRRATRECLALRWNGGALVCTPDHPLYDPDRAAYRPASDWITGDARTLLARTGDGVRAVTVDIGDSHAGVHEVLDITVDAAPHNFIAGGVVVHNKSGEDPQETEYELDGPDLKLTADDRTREFLVRTCFDGQDLELDDDPRLRVSFVVKALQQNDQHLVIYDEAARDEATDVVAPTAVGAPLPIPGASCTVGQTVVFERSAAPPSGWITVEWAMHLVVPGEHPGAATFEIEPSVDR